MLYIYIIYVYGSFDFHFLVLVISSFKLSIYTDIKNMHFVPNKLIKSILH